MQSLQKKTWKTRDMSILVIVKALRKNLSVWNNLERKEGILEWKKKKISYHNRKSQISKIG